MQILNLRKAALICTAAGLLGGFMLAAWAGRLSAQQQSNPTSPAVRVHFGPEAPLRVALRQAGLSIAEANGASAAAQDALGAGFNATGLEAELHLERLPDQSDARLVSMDIGDGRQTLGQVTRTADGGYRGVLLAQVEPSAASPATPRPLTTKFKPVLRRGPIEDVLYGDAQSPQEATVVYQTVSLLAHQLDFSRDVAIGDPIQILYQLALDDRGAPTGDAQLLQLTLKTQNTTVKIYRYHPPNGHDDAFLDDKGFNVEQSLLRTPLKNPRITSLFGERLHPILGFTRTHKGVDFGAPIGTPIVAAADAQVEEVRQSPGYGRFIKLRHNRDLETLYGHLSAWAPGLAAGSHVRGGQIIGYVGSSGLSTGPHLHYEIVANARPVDPRLAAPVLRSQLSPLEMAMFVRTKSDAERLADALAATGSTGAVATGGR